MHNVESLTAILIICLVMSFALCVAAIVNMHKAEQRELKLRKAFNRSFNCEL